MSEKNNVIDITEKYKTLKELQDYARSQFLTLLQCQKMIETLELENKKLQKDLEQSRNPEIQTLVRSPEQDLCEIELRRLRDITLERSLTLEEAKKMDLYVKNLYLAKGKPTQTIETKGKSKEYSDAELIELALKKGSNE